MVDKPGVYCESKLSRELPVLFAPFYKLIAIVVLQ